MFAINLAAPFDSESYSKACLIYHTRCERFLAFWYSKERKLQINLEGKGERGKDREKERRKEKEKESQGKERKKKERKGHFYRAYVHGVHWSPKKSLQSNSVSAHCFPKCIHRKPQGLFKFLWKLPSHQFKLDMSQKRQELWGEELTNWKTSQERDRTRLLSCGLISPSRGQMWRGNGIVWIFLWITNVEYLGELAFLPTAVRNQCKGPSFLRVWEEKIVENLLYKLFPMTWHPRNSPALFNEKPGLRNLRKIYRWRKFQKGQGLVGSIVDKGLTFFRKLHSNISSHRAFAHRAVVCLECPSFPFS